MRIDLVYLWVDGSDPVWRAKKNSFLPPEEQRDLESFAGGRFFDNEELHYSLRSVEQYAPWINHIYIVTDKQQPSWLNTDHEKITIVDHTDILPHTALPTFNSTAIELGIANIKGLSEYFLFANDDTFFYHKVDPEFFITKNGVMKCRFNTMNNTDEQIEESTYRTTISNVNKVIYNDFKLEICKDHKNLQPHHNIDIYSKSSIKELLERYANWVDQSIHNRFRSPKDIQRHIFSLYDVAMGRAVAILPAPLPRAKKLKLRLGLWRGVDSLAISLNDIKECRRYIDNRNPALICINDNQDATASDRAYAKVFMEREFPTRSTFEL